MTSANSTQSQTLRRDLFAANRAVLTRLSPHSAAVAVRALLVTADGSAAEAVLLDALLPAAAQTLRHDELRECRRPAVRALVLSHLVELGCLCSTLLEHEPVQVQLLAESLMQTRVMARFDGASAVAA
jgi:hypothetical protein